MASMKSYLVTPTDIDANSHDDILVEAHTATIEPSGALSFWLVSVDNMVSMLLFAFGVGEWKRLILQMPKAPEPKLCAVGTCTSPVLGNLEVCFSHAKVGPDGQPINPE